MDYTYELKCAEQLSPAQQETILDALQRHAYVCQQEFEKYIDLYHEINVLADANGEAFVSRIEIECDEVLVTLDCSEVRYF